MLVLLVSLDSKKDRRSVGFIVENGNRLLLFVLDFAFLLAHNIVLVAAH
jgi:hypothetical protein